jgi:predicted dehydrogenase
MTIGIGIVGAGMISTFHAKAIADTANGKLIGCYDRSGERAEQFAAANHCRAYATLEEMLADPAISAVAICTPSGAHLEPAVAAAEAGKHVIVEKPLEVTIEKCDAIIAACNKANVKLAATFQSRFHKSSQLMKAAVDAGRFGKITMGDAYVKWYRSQEYYDSGAWRGTWALDGGGALMNQAIHSVDLLLWLMGPAKRVSAMMNTLTHERIEVEDIVVANVMFESGALGVVEATTTAFPGALKRVEIAGSEGSAVLEEEDIIQWTFRNETDADQTIRESMAGQNQTGGGASDPSAIGHHGHTEVFNDFLDAIEHDREPLVNGVEGRRSVELICAIYESAKTGRTIEM